MTFLTTLLLFGAAALGFFLLVDGVSYFVANSGNRGEARTDRRLDEIASNEREARIETLARDEPEKIASSLGQFLDRLIVRANSKMTPQRIFLVMALVGVATTAGMSLAAPYLPMPIHILIGVCVGLAAPIMHLNSMANKRKEKFQEQLPDAIDLVVRSLRIGHPLNAALQTIANELPDPLGSEFEVASRQVQYGKTPPQALNGLSQRIDLADIRFFAVATQIHHESGGNLAEILEGLSRVIRARFQLFRKIKALTVEGRFSAWFLSLFPVVMIFAMNLLQPGYYEKVSDFELFPHLVALTFFMLIVNVIAMRVMTKIEV